MKIKARMHKIGNDMVELVDEDEKFYFGAVNLDFFFEPNSSEGISQKIKELDGEFLTLNMSIADEYVTICREEYEDLISDQTDLNTLERAMRNESTTKD